MSGVSPEIIGKEILTSLPGSSDQILKMWPEELSLQRGLCLTRSEYGTIYALGHAQKQYSDWQLVIRYDTKSGRERNKDQRKDRKGDLLKTLSLRATVHKSKAPQSDEQLW